MNQLTAEVKVRPDNGCARCLWWRQCRYSAWGRCLVHRVRTWWQHAACSDYDRDCEIIDTIRVYNDVG